MSHYATPKEPSSGFIFHLAANAHAFYTHRSALLMNRIAYNKHNWVLLPQI